MVSEPLNVQIGKEQNAGVSSVQNAGQGKKVDELEKFQNALKPIKVRGVQPEPTRISNYFQLLEIDEQNDKMVGRGGPFHW